VKQNYISFYPIQSVISHDFLLENGISVHEHYDSSYLITQHRILKKSRAFFALCKEMTYPLKMMYLFRFFPRPLTDLIYDFIAKNRFNFFGRQEKTCGLITINNPMAILSDEEAEDFFLKFRCKNESKKK